MRLVGVSLALLLACASLASGASLAAGGQQRSCQGAGLSGSFRAVPGSAGAGNVSYRLELRNTSTASCFVSGIPGLTLLDRSQRPLPTHARFAGPLGALSSVLVELAPGHAASLTARFSPDVPGPGEPQTRACEPTAVSVRVALQGGGSLLAPISPPTAVCEHGTLQLTAFAAG